MQSVIVASLNPVKINAVRQGFERMIPEVDFKFIGVQSQSGVSAQPMSDGETLRGALNRVAFAKEKYPDADYWAGLEGGIESYLGRMSTYAWVVISSRSGIGKSRTASHELPDVISRLVSSGLELGDADDQFYKRTNSKQLNGSIGLLTGDLYTRTTLYEEAVVFALIPIRNAEKYKHD